jgi:hypothetical protein
MEVACIKLDMAGSLACQAQMVKGIWSEINVVDPKVVPLTFCHIGCLGED